MSVLRRDLLSLMLAAPVAGQSCQRLRRTYAGEVRGASHQTGHRLKQASHEQVRGKPARTGVAIVGAGPAGLCAAWRLSRSGYHDYTVFDLEPRVGGTSTYGEDGVVPYPWGAHYVPLPLAGNPAFRVLLEEMGAPVTAQDALALERLRIREPDERLFYDGRWHAGLFPSAGANKDDLAELARFEKQVQRYVEFRDGQGRRAFALPMRQSSQDARVTRLDSLSAAAWLGQLGIRSQRVLWYLELACRDDYGMNLEQTSAWALLFYFCSRREHGKADSQPLLAWPEGNGRLVRHLSERCKGRILTEQLVTDVTPEAEQVKLAVFEVATQKLRAVVADHVILAVPQFVAGRILRPWRERRPAHLDDFSYGAWLVANLHLRRAPKNLGAPPAWDNVLKESPSLGYVSAGHQALRDIGPDVWTYYLPLTGPELPEERQRLLEVDHQTWARAIVSDLSRAHSDLDALVERIDIYKWGHAMVRPTPGFIFGASRGRAATGLPRVHFAHSDLSGLALFEEAQDRGVLAAERVLTAFGRPVAALAG